MKFQEITHILKKYINADENITTFMIDLIDNFGEYDSSNSPCDKVKNRSTWNRYYNGKNIKDLSQKVFSSGVDSEILKNYLYEVVDDEMASILVNEFIGKIKDIDIYNFGDKIANELINSLRPCNNKNPEELTDEERKKISAEIDKDILEDIELKKEKAKTIMPAGISEYYDLKTDYSRGKPMLVTVPKNDDVYKTHPEVLTIKFDTSNKTPDEIERLRDIPRLQREANLTNKPILIGKPKEYMSTIDKIHNPFSIYRAENPQDTLWYILPKEEVKEVKLRIELTNKHDSFILDNIRMHILDFVERERFTLSNIRFSDYFELVIESRIKNNTENINMNLKIRNNCLNNIYARKEFYRWSTLINDKKTIVTLTSYINENPYPLIKNKPIGKFSIPAKEYTLYKKRISMFNKLISIESILNKKFNFEFDFKLFDNSFDIIDLAYFSLTGKTKNIKKESFWELTMDDKADYEKYSVGQTLRNKSIQIAHITLFDQKIMLNNFFITFERAEVLDKTCIEKGKIYAVKLKFSSAKINIK